MYAKSKYTEYTPLFSVTLNDKHPYDSVAWCRNMLYGV